MTYWAWHEAGQKTPKIDFFNSMGLSQESYGLKFPYAITNKNRFQLQSDDSDVCALYVAYFYYFRSRNFSLKEIESHFCSHNKNRNDVKIRRFYQSLQFYKCNKAHLIIFKTYLIHILF
jgi:hypothetical protein